MKRKNKQYLTRGTSTPQSGARTTEERGPQKVPGIFISSPTGRRGATFWGWFGAILLIALLWGGRFSAMAGEAIAPSDVSVKVEYQLKPKGGNSWTTANASLRGAVTESMMKNQLAARHPASEIRILAASWGKPVSHFVRYQIKWKNSAWTTGTITLTNALTESMARNQLKAKFPGASVRILSFTQK